MLQLILLVIAVIFLACSAAIAQTGFEIRQFGVIKIESLSLHETP